VNLLYCYLGHISSLFSQDSILGLYYMLIIIEGCLDAVGNLRDPIKCFSAYTTPANVVHTEVASELPCFTYKGITLWTEGGWPRYRLDSSEYLDLTCRIDFDSKRIRDFIEEVYVGPPLLLMNWGHSLRAIWSIPFMLLRDVISMLSVYK
jgi:hypothetical protein